VLLGETDAVDHHRGIPERGKELAQRSVACKGVALRCVPAIGHQPNDNVETGRRPAHMLCDNLATHVERGRKARVAMCRLCHHDLLKVLPCVGKSLGSGLVQYHFDGERRLLAERLADDVEQCLLYLVPRRPHRGTLICKQHKQRLALLRGRRL